MIKENNGSLATDLFWSQSRLGGVMALCFLIDIRLWFNVCVDMVSACIHCITIITGWRDTQGKVIWSQLISCQYWHQLSDTRWTPSHHITLVLMKFSQNTLHRSVCGLKPDICFIWNVNGKEQVRPTYSQSVATIVELSSASLKLNFLWVLHHAGEVLKSNYKINLITA